MSFLLLCVCDPIFAPCPSCFEQGVNFLGGNGHRASRFICILKFYTLVNQQLQICKELGNQCPSVLDQLQREILHEVFRQSCGLQSSVETAQRLSEMWEDRDWGKELGEVAEYYKKCTSVIPHRILAC
jgi:hypothetical protein